MQTNVRQQESWKPAKTFLPLLAELDTEIDADLEKIALFEKGLSKELKASDSLDKTVGKMVKMALAAEFGASFCKAKGCDTMIDKITEMMQADPQLRRQSLLIIDRFVKK